MPLSTVSAVLNRQGHRPARPDRARAGCPLRALAARRARPHRRQEARTDRRRRRQTRRLTAQRARTDPGKRRRARPATAARSAGSTSTSPSTTTAASPTPRSSPTRKPRPRSASSRRAIAFFARYGITVERVITDNGSAYRSTSTRSPADALGIRHLRTRPSAPRQTAKPNASSAPCSPAGPTARSTAQATNAPEPLTAGSGTTTIDDDTQPSATNPRSAEPTCLGLTASRRRAGDRLLRETRPDRPGGDPRGRLPRPARRARASRGGARAKPVRSLLPSRRAAERGCLCGCTRSSWRPTSAAARPRVRPASPTGSSRLRARTARQMGPSRCSRPPPPPGSPQGTGPGARAARRDRADARRT